MVDVDCVWLVIIDLDCSVIIDLDYCGMFLKLLFVRDVGGDKVRSALLVRRRRLFLYLSNLWYGSGADRA